MVLKTQYDVIVIGGGAAGMMAAGRAAERGRRVLLLEKNTRLGKKLSITGGGRCNICNAQQDQHLLLKNYGSAEKFLYTPFSQFGVAETFNFFASHGVPLKIEANHRAFPKTEKAGDVVLALEGYVRKGKVTIQTSAQVKGFLVEGGTIVGIKAQNKILSAESYILATGGTSHPDTGSTGDGFRWLAELGHGVKKPTPTVVPLVVQDRWIKALAGVALDEVKVTFFVDGKKRLAVKGRVLCTHFGFSGPLILNAAGKVADMLHDGTVTATIDVVPRLDHGALDRQITDVFDKNKNRDVKNVMKLLTPTGAAASILTLLPLLSVEKKVHSVTKAERKSLVSLLKALPVTISGLMGYERAVVVDGGVSIRDVDGRTMRSRKHANLFVTGDLLDIRRPSGGYSLQLCWTTGWVAGNNA